MRRSFFARLVLLNTFKKRLRAALVVGGIAISSSVMIVLFGVSDGLHDLVSTEVRNSDAKDVITVDQRNLQQIRFDQERVSDITSISGVGQVESSVGLLGNVVYHGINLTIPVYGASKDYFALAPTSVAAGQTQLSGNNIVVSTKVLEAFELTPQDAIGREVVMAVTIPAEYRSGEDPEAVVTAQETFKIVGVAEKGQSPVAYASLEALRLKGLDNVSQLKVMVSSSDKIPTVRESVEQMGFQTTSIQDTVEQIEKIFTVIQKTILVFGLIVFAITVSSTFTIISLTLMEDMRQIGFLRINGLRNSDVRIMFLAQSVIMTTLGAASGVLLGLLGGAVVNALARSAASDAVFSGEVDLFATPSAQISVVMLLSVAIGYGVAVLPARRAVAIAPLEELKL